MLVRVNFRAIQRAAAAAFCHGSAEADATLVLNLLADDNSTANLDRLNRWAAQHPIRDARVVASVLERIGNANRGTTFFRWVAASPSSFVHTTFTYNRFIHLLLKSGRHRDAYTVFDTEMRSRGSFDSYSYFLLVKAFAAAGELEQAMDLLQDMRSKGLVPQTSLHNFIVAGFCKLGKVGQAMEVFERMKDRKGFFGPDVATFNTVISGLCKAGKLEDAKVLFSGMRSAGYIPNVVTCNALICGMSNAGQVDDAELIMQGLMLRHGLSPDAVTYNSLIHGFCKNGAVEKAYMILKAMKSRGYSPDMYSYTVVVDGLCKASKLAIAYEIVEEMVAKGCSPTMATYSVVLAGLCRAREIAKAKQIFGFMSRSGCSPDMVAYGTLMDAVCKAGDVETGMKLMEEMEVRGWKPDSRVYEVLISGLCKVKRFHEASLQLEKVKACCSSSPATCIAVLNGLWRSGKADEARKLLEKLTPAMDRVAFQVVLRGVEGEILDRETLEKQSKKFSSI